MEDDFVAASDLLLFVSKCIETTQGDLHPNLRREDTMSSVFSKCAEACRICYVFELWLAPGRHQMYLP